MSELSLGAYNCMKSCFLAQEATRKGKAVIDCGATESLGGIGALENLARKNVKRHGTSCMRIDFNDRPVYSFGNGESTRVDGRATFEVEAAGNSGKECYSKVLLVQLVPSNSHLEGGVDVRLDRCMYVTQ